MSNIIVRPYEERDRDGYFHVRAMTYNDGVPIPPENQVIRTTRGFVGEVGGHVDGIYNVLDLTCSRGPAVLKCGGIAGVGVLPERRQSGVGAAMMAEAVRMLRQEGTPMASLYAFRESFYRRFGYEMCGKRYEITCPNNRYPKVASELQVGKVAAGEIHRVQPCLEAFVKARSGGNVRTLLHWERVLGEKTNVYAAGDPVEAYAIVRHSTDFWEEQVISEVVWSTRRGYDAILSTLTNIGINKTGLRWWEPSDSPFVTQYMDQGVGVALKRSTMYRVTDVPAALMHLQTGATGSFSIAIDDDVIPENGGPWRVAFAPGEISIEKVDGADLRMTIQAFTQAFLGDPSLTDLARNGLISVQSAQALSEAEKLLPPSPVYCLEAF